MVVMQEIDQGKQDQKKLASAGVSEEIVSAARRLAWSISSVKATVCLFTARLCLERGFKV